MEVNYVPIPENGSKYDNFTFSKNIPPMGLKLAHENKSLTSLQNDVWLCAQSDQPASQQHETVVRFQNLKGNAIGDMPVSIGFGPKLSTYSNQNKYVKK